jgi:signal transduction histidine kinase
MPRKKPWPASTRRAGSVDPPIPSPSPQRHLDQVADLIESERAQIGHEIHDGLLPLIFAAAASVASLLEQLPAEAQQACEPPGPAPQASPPQANHGTEQQTRQRLQQVAAWLDGAMLTARQLLTQVYPPELVGTLWTRAARDTIERLFPDTPADIHWQIDPRAQETARPLALTAYRITVEAVRNSIRHGRAKHVSIDARVDAGALRVTIRDDGRGFDPAQVPSDRFGIRTMISRAQLVGGDLQVDSQPGGPTIVSFTVDGAGPPA